MSATLPVGAVSTSDGSLRDDIVTAALAAFTAEPYADVSCAGIAAAAGVSEETLATLFPTKQALYAAAMEASCARLVGAVEAATDVDAGLAPLERLERGLDAFLDYVSAHAASYVALMRDAVGVDAHVAAVVEESRETLRARLFAGLCGKAKTERMQSQLQRWVAAVETATLEWLAAGQGDRTTFLGEAREALLVAKLGPIGPIRPF